MSYSKSLAADSFLAAAGAIGAVVFGSALKILLARSLSVYDFGVLITAQAVVGFVAFVSTACIPDAVVWRSAKDLSLDTRAGPTVTAGVASTTVFTAIALAVLLLIAPRLEHAYRQIGLGRTLTLLALTIPINGISDTFAAAIRGAGRLWPKVIVLDLGRTAVALVFAGLGAAIGISSLTSVSAAFVCAAAAVGIVPVVLAFRSQAISPSRSWSSRHTGLLLRYGLPLVAAGVLAGPIVNTGIPLVLGAFVPAQDIALYSAALAFQVVVYVPVAAVEQAALPGWSSNHDLLSSHFRSITRWSLLAASVPFALLWIAPSQALSLVYGGRYAAAGPLLRIAAAAALFGAAVGPNEAALKATGHTRCIFVTRLIAGSCGLMVGWLLIPVWGAYGGVVGFCATTVIVNAVYGACLWYYHRLHPLAPEYMRVALAIVTALVTVNAVLSRISVGNATVVVMTLICYAAALLISLVAVRAREVKVLFDSINVHARQARTAVHAHFKPGPIA